MRYVRGNFYVCDKAVGKVRNEVGGMKIVVLMGA